MAAQQRQQSWKIQELKIHWLSRWRRSPSRHTLELDRYLKWSQPWKYKMGQRKGCLTSNRLSEAELGTWRRKQKSSPYPPWQGHCSLGKLTLSSQHNQQKSMNSKLTCTLEKITLAHTRTCSRSEIQSAMKIQNYALATVSQIDMSTNYKNNGSWLENYEL